MSAALTRFDPPAADQAARHGSRTGGAQPRQDDKAAAQGGAASGGADEWRGPEAIAAERARRNGAGDSRRETGAAGLDQAASGLGSAASSDGNAVGRHGEIEAGSDDAAVAARVGHLAFGARKALADLEATADGAARAVAQALARVAPEGEEVAIAQAQDPAARFFASLERLRALAGQLDGAGGVQADGAASVQAIPGQVVLAQASPGRSSADPASGPKAAQMQAARQAARQAGAGAAVDAAASPATMDTDESLHLSLRDNRGQSGLGARHASGLSEVRIVSRTTHFAPVSQSALGTKNMDALAKAFDDGAAFMREAGQNIPVRGGEARGAEMRGGGFDQTLGGSLRSEGMRPAGPVKMLTIQLTPVSLGKISVAMHLSDGAMRMEITVSEPRALEMVRADKDLIGNLIRKSGLSPESITIQSGDPAQAGRQNAGGQNNAGQNGQQGLGQQGDGGGSRRDNGGEGGSRPGPDREGASYHETAQGTRLSDGGDIYL